MHSVTVINFKGRVAASCTCGDLYSPERFGKNAIKQATYDGRVHLAEIEKIAQKKQKLVEAWLNPGWGFIDNTGKVVNVSVVDNYHVFAECPFCEGHIDCGSGLIFENLNVACDLSSHLFVAYYEGGETATLFKQDAAEPFITY